MNTPLLGRAQAALAAGRMTDAATLYREVVARWPHEGAGWLALSVAAAALGQADDALAAAERAASLLPTHASAWANVAERRRQAGRMDEAGAAFARLAALPGLPADLAADAENGLALVARHNGQTLAAEAHWRRAIALDPTFAGAYANLGKMLFDQQAMHAARAALRQAVTLDPTDGGARMNLALAHKALEQQAVAVEELRHLLAQPGISEQLAHDARHNLARLLLLQGPGSEAWALHESRWKASHFPSVRRSFPVPVWQGDSLMGRRLLLWGEQGLGDEILFASQVPDLAAGLTDAVRAAGTDILLECDERLVPLFARSFAPVTVVGRPAAVALSGSRDASADSRTATATAQLPTGSLARYCRPSLASFRGARPFLKPDPDRATPWARRVAALGPGLKVGLCWTSGLLTAERAISYTTLADWLPLAQVPGIHLVSLQYNRDISAIEIPQARARGLDVADWPDLDQRNDLEGVAALISTLDLVLTAPTSVGEIAAGLGVPTWRISTPSQDWSGLGTMVRPWYPAMRIFPAPREEETLADVIQRMVHALTALITPAASPTSLAEALALHQAGRVDEAEAAYRRLLADGPAEAQARGDTLHLLGLLLHQVSRPEEAEPLLRQALAAEPGFFEAWNSLGAVLLALGRRAEAAEAWRTALRLNPNYDKAAANLGRLGP
ncbi:tetratricopeptide repeat protein [Nitrospirillum sp. BR 11163]|uniref:tetratricopeptide repeat protein n=1 Tax=Nitrospirillum sp. BR 11163 TaxID=3104323 RepID=UPI002AFFCAF4|nr:tetratricopeptide repeat protein [Nitrospirillum sp. BR 11163]MEA1675065.1 tetratricopeptide repeat protein [Nitrospirillum sp. BR 11163]